MKTRKDIDMDSRQAQRNIIRKLDVQCKAHGCTSPVVSLFINLCNKCLKKEATKEPIKGQCIMADCSDETASSVFNFCKGCVSIGLENLGVGRRRNFNRKAKHYVVDN